MDDNVALYRKILLSELHKIMVNIVTFYSLRGSIVPIAPPGSAPVSCRIFFTSGSSITI